MDQELQKVVTMDLVDGTQVEFHISQKLEEHLRLKHNVAENEQLPEELLKQFLLKFIQQAEVENNA
jgi:hypothetical protein